MDTESQASTLFASSNTFWWRRKWQPTPIFLSGKSHGLQHARLPSPSPSPGICSHSSPLSWWYHPTISSSVVPFSSCPQSCPASGSFPVNWLFASGGQTIRASALVSVFPMNIQDWFSLGLTGLISLLFKGLSRVFSNTTVRKHQFFGSQPSLWSNSYITHDYWKKYSFDRTSLWGQSDVSVFEYDVKVCNNFSSKEQASLISWLWHHLQWFWSPRK